MGMESASSDDVADVAADVAANVATMDSSIEGVSDVFAAERSTTGASFSEVPASSRVQADAGAEPGIADAAAVEVDGAYRTSDHDLAKHVLAGSHKDSAKHPHSEQDNGSKNEKGA